MEGFRRRLLIASLCLAAAMAAPASGWAATKARAPISPTYPDKDAALVVDGDTGKVLYSRNASAKRHPASLTKMMTLYLLFEALKKGQVTLDSPFSVSAHAAGQAPTKLGLKIGSTISVETAIKAIVVRSANDVAVVIAEALGGTESHFAELMTARARQMGMRSTYFHNASGLPDPLQISTAEDLALLARHVAYDFPNYYTYFATPSFTYKGSTWPTHNNLIGRYKGADGIKTGYVSASGFNLVSSVVRDRVHLIGVVLGGRTAVRRDNEMIRILDNAFDEIKTNPMLVAHNDVPWRTATDVTPSSQSFAAVPTVVATTNSPTDEDAAELRADEDQVPSLLAKVAIRPTPKPALMVASLSPAQRIAPTPKPVPAAAKPAPAPAQAPVRTASIAPVKPAGASVKAKSEWTIQIGAFSDIALAKAQLASYAEKSMDMLGQAARLVVPFQAVDGHTLYRARFGPFAEREAREVCSRLSARGQTCFAALR